MRNVGSSVGGLQGRLRYLTPPSGSPIPKPPFPPIPGGGALGVLGVITGAIALIGALGANKFRDDQLAKLGKGYNETTGLSSSLNPNTGDKPLSSTPPFTGGQSAGVGYVLVFSRTGGSENETLRQPDGTAIYGDKRPAWIAIGSSGGGIMSYTSASDAVSKLTGSPALGKINGIVSNQLVGGGLTPNRQIVISTDSGNITFISGSNSGFVFGGVSYVAYEYAFVGAYRKDGQPDTGGDPSGTPLGTVPSGYTGGETLEDMLSRSLSAIGLTGLKGFPSVAPNALGLGTEKNPKDLLPNPGGKPLSPAAKNPIKSPTPSPIKPVPAIPSPVPTPSPEPPNTDTDIRNKLAQIIGITTLINSNTQPEQQRQNAKAGSCDALQSPQCTKGVEDRIKDPIMGNVDATKVQTTAILGNQAIQNGTLASIVSKLDLAKEFGEKVARAARLDKVYNLLTFITVIHNAQMLSSSLATTLMDALSLGLATIGIKDENESPIDIQSIINKTVEDTVKGIIGTANYTTISDRWKNAVRVYQAAANIAYQVRSLWDSARSLAELTGANVGKIGNALRRDGVVSENAYGAMADNPLMVNNAMTKLQNLEEAASHINSITSEAYGVTETVAQIKKDQDDFKKLAKEGLSSPTPIVNDQQKAKDDAAKLASVSPSITKTDLVKPD